MVDRFDPPAPASDAERKTYESEAERREAVRQQFVVEHPLQAFSPAYFDPGNETLWSFDAGACAGARGLVQPKVAIDRRLFAQPMAEAESPKGERVTVALRDLQRFWKHPTEALLRHRFGLAWSRDDAALSRREPVGLRPARAESPGAAVARLVGGRRC